MTTKWLGVNSSTILWKILFHKFYGKQEFEVPQILWKWIQYKLWKESFQFNLPWVDEFTLGLFPRTTTAKLSVLEKEGEEWEKKETFLLSILASSLSSPKWTRSWRRKSFSNLFSSHYILTTHTPVFNLAKKMKATSTVAFFTRHVWSSGETFLVELMIIFTVNFAR